MSLQESAALPGRILFTYNIESMVCEEPVFSSSPTPEKFEFYNEKRHIIKV